VNDKVAFCVVTWNNADVVGECLDALCAQQGVAFDVYVLDNASEDGTPEVLRGYPRARVTAGRVNEGFAGGNNRLVAQALRDPEVGYVALVNSDAVLAPDWAATLVRFAAERPRTGCLQGVTLDYYDRSKVDSLHIFVNGRLQGQQYGYGEPYQPERYAARKVFGVNAAAAMYTRAMICGLPDQGKRFFDERFFMYYEDIDVCFRALLTGWDAWFVPEALAYHMGSVSAKKRGSSFAATMVARNQAAMLAKNAPWTVVRRSLPSYVYGLIVYLREIRRDLGAQAALATAASFVRGLARTPLYWASRRRIQAAAVVDADYLLRVMHNGGILG